MGLGLGLGPGPGPGRRRRTEKDGERQRGPYTSKAARKTAVASLEPDRGLSRAAGTEAKEGKETSESRSARSSGKHDISHDGRSPRYPFLVVCAVCFLQREGEGDAPREGLKWCIPSQKRLASRDTGEPAICAEKRVTENKIETLRDK